MNTSLKHEDYTDEQLTKEIEACGKFGLLSLIINITGYDIDANPRLLRLILAATEKMLLTNEESYFNSALEYKAKEMRTLASRIVEPDLLRRKHLDERYEESKCRACL